MVWIEVGWEGENTGRADNEGERGSEDNWQ